MLKFEGAEGGVQPPPQDVPAQKASGRFPFDCKSAPTLSICIPLFVHPPQLCNPTT